MASVAPEAVSPPCLPQRQHTAVGFTSPGNRPTRLHLPPTTCLHLTGLNYDFDGIRVQHTKHPRSGTTRSRSAAPGSATDPRRPPPQAPHDRPSVPRRPRAGAASLPPQTPRVPGGMEGKGTAPGRERLRDGTGRAGSPVTGRSHHRTEPLAPFGASLPPVPAEGGAVKSVFGSDGPIIIGLQTEPAAARESRESPARNVRRRYKTTAVRPRWDSNPQSPAPEADALSIRPLGHPAKAASAVL